MREQNVPSFEEISRATQQEEGDALVEGGRRSTALDEAAVGRRSAVLPRRGDAAESGRSGPEPPSPDHGPMGLVLRRG